MVPVDAPKTAELKRLAFVEAYLGVVIILSQRGYSSVKAYVPSSVLPYVASCEEYVTAYAAPWLNLAQDKGAKLIVRADVMVSSIAYAGVLGCGEPNSGSE